MHCSGATLTAWVNCDQAPALCKVSSPDPEAEPCGWEAESFPELQTGSCRAGPIPGQTQEDGFFLPVCFSCAGVGTQRLVHAGKHLTSEGLTALLFLVLERWC